jgi:SAM-dependent methyltransferase
VVHSNKGGFVMSADRFSPAPEVKEIEKSPAEIYEALFVPALFGQWGPIVAGEARIGKGDRVIDVACGTGVLALAALERAGAEGEVVGLDPNPDMLGVARRKSPRIGWRDGRAEEIPFPDGRFDAAVSQFGLMFFEDRAAGLREMMRVLRPGGRLACAVCGALDHAPGYAAVANMLERLFGSGIADAFRAPFALGDSERLSALCAQAGMQGAEVKRHNGTVRFASIRSLISSERACVWTLGGLLDEEEFERLSSEAEQVLLPFATAHGALAFDMSALVITASKH